MDGRIQQVARCAPVHSAGSQLPLEGTEMYLFAQMVKSRFCNASCAPAAGVAVTTPTHAEPGGGRNRPVGGWGIREEELGEGSCRNTITGPPASRKAEAGGPQGGLGVNCRRRREMS